MQHDVYLSTNKICHNIQGFPKGMALSLLAMLAIATQLATKGIDLQMVSKISCQDRYIK